MPKSTKADKATYEARVDKVYEYQIAGMNRGRIWQYVTNPKNKDFELFKDISQRQLDRYIAAANGLLIAEAAFHREREFGRALARMNEIFYASLKVQDYQRAIAAARELHQLLGLYAPKILELRGSDAAALSELLDQLKARGIPASEVFNAMLEIVASEKVEKNGS